MLFAKSGFGFLLTALAHLLNTITCIYISGQKWNNGDLQYFQNKSMPPAPAPLTQQILYTVDFYGLFTQYM